MESATSSYGLLRKLSAGLQATLLLACLFVSVSLLWWSTAIPDSAARQVASAIATGLLVSASFGIAQAYVTGRASTELLRSAVVGEVSSSLAALNKSYFPTHEFQPSPRPDPEFNVTINHDLGNSSVVWFQGGSGQYAAARLLLNRGVNLQVNIILPDPRAEGSLDGRADYSYRHNLYREASIEQIRQVTMNNLSMGIVGLFEARDKCSDIRIVLTPMPSLDRYEIFRDAIWVTLFSDNGTGMKFPRTLRFESSSVIYRIQEAECLQTKNSPRARVIELPPRMSTETKVGIYNAVFGAQMSDDEYLERRSRFLKFADEVIKSYGPHTR